MFVKTMKGCFFGFMILSWLPGCSQPPEPTSRIVDVRQHMQDLDRGRYVIEVMGCNDCHSPDYIVKRGNIPEQDWLVGNTLGFRSSNGTRYPTNLRLLVDHLTEEDWLTLARKMRKETPMADAMLPQTAESDLRAMYKYIKYLGPRGQKAPDSLPADVVPQTPYILSPGPH